MTASSVSGPCRCMRSSRSAPAIGGGTLSSEVKETDTAAFLGGTAGYNDGVQEAEIVFVDVVAVDVPGLVT